MTDYWIEHAEIALNEAGLPKATDEQLEAIAGVIESAHEFYGQAMGHDVASANFKSEEKRRAEEAETKLERERSKVMCRSCKGTGREVVHGPYHSSDSECFKCRGSGRHD
jgi:DnaJ-class molecular chaperone